MKVEQFYNKNQFVIKNGNEIYLQSYESTVAKIGENGILWLGNDWDYSKTTLKYLYLFIDEYKYNLQDYLYNNLRNLQDIANKKKYIQKLINDKIISIITL